MLGDRPRPSVDTRDLDLDGSRKDGGDGTGRGALAPGSRERIDGDNEGGDDKALGISDRDVLVRSQDVRSKADDG